MLRFLWERNKIRQQRDDSGLQKISAEDFDPYPGYFMKDNLDDLIFRSQTMLALEYLAEGKSDDAKEALRNIYLSKNSPILEINAFDNYVAFQKIWIEFIDEVNKFEDRSGLITKI